MEWLGLAAEERVSIVEKAHLRVRMWHPLPRNMQVHARMHVAVENRLAMSDPPCLQEALDRLTQAGVDRHAAVHALGSVVEDLLQIAMHDGNAFDEAECDRRLRDIRPDDWRVAEADRARRPPPRRGPRKPR
jgi:hypothetical protein